MTPTPGRKSATASEGGDIDAHLDGQPPGADDQLTPLRIFVAGASGVIGIRLVPRLVEAGHVVAGMTRTPSKVALLRGLGAEPILADVFDVDALERAVRDFGPDVVIHELTDLPDDPRRIPECAPAHARIRREGTQNLLAAARLASVERMLAQSVAWEVAGDVGAATRDLERFVLGAGGVVLRYGRLYGPGTYYERALPEPPRVHVEEAARWTAEALDAPTGIVTIVEA